MEAERERATAPEREAAAIEPPHAWIGRYRALRTKLAVALLAGALVLVAAIWVKRTFLSVAPGPGTPIGLAARTDGHIAVLLRTLEPYTPSLHRDASRDRYRVGVCLVPLDGTATRTVPLAAGLTASELSLAKVLGSDGGKLWLDAAGLRGVDWRTLEALPEAEVRRVDPASLPRPWDGAPLPPKPEQHLATGLFTAPDAWLGLCTDAEAARDLAPGRTTKRVVRADRTKAPRRLYRASVEAEASDGRHRILSREPVGASAWVDAAFLRLDDASEPLVLDGLPGVLMVHASDAGRNATVALARIDLTGDLRWSVDTGVDRFTLQQILPGKESVAFLGTRPPVPGAVSEPLLVIVDTATGHARTESLWR